MCIRNCEEKQLAAQKPAPSHEDPILVQTETEDFCFFQITVHSPNRDCGQWPRCVFKSTDMSWKSFSRANRSSRRQIWGVCVGGDGIPGRGKGRGSERGAQGGLRRKSTWVSQRVWDKTLKPTWRRPALLLLLLLAEKIFRLRTQLTIYDARQDGLNSP